MNIGVKSELIKRLSSHTTAALQLSFDYLQKPATKSVNRLNSLLIKKSKVILDDDVSVLIDGTSDEKKMSRRSSSSDSNNGSSSSSSSDSSRSSGSRFGLKHSHSHIKDDMSNTNSLSTQDAKHGEKNSRNNDILKKSKKVSYSIDDDDFLDELMSGGQCSDSDNDGDRGSSDDRSNQLPAQSRGNKPTSSSNGNEIKDSRRDNDDHNSGYEPNKAKQVNINKKSKSNNKIDSEDMGLRTSEEENIQTMVNERMQAKYSKDYDEADSIREQLK